MSETTAILARIKEIFLKRMEELSLSFFELSLKLNRTEKQVKRWFSDGYDFNLRILCILSNALDIKFSIELKEKN